MNQKKYLSRSLLLLLGISIAGSLMLYWATIPWGIGACNDSAMYISGARNILSGQGYRSYTSLRVITQWPPFFSFSMALLGFFGIDPLEGARVLNVTLFGLNILMAGLIVKKFTQSTKMALLAAWLMLTSSALLSIHSMAWSEPWFIFLAFTGFYFLIQYLGGSPKRYLFYAAALTSLACLDRYAGASAFAAGILTLLFLHQKNLRTRFVDTMSYAVLVFIPVGLWLVRNNLLAHNLVNRSFGFHFPPSKYFKECLKTFSSWVLSLEFPASVRNWALLAVVIIITAIWIIVLWKEIRRHTLKALVSDNGLRLVVAMVFFIVCNAALELAHLILINVKARGDDRHFAPFFVAGLLSFSVLADRFFKLYPDRPFVKHIPVVLLVLLGSSSTFTSTQKLTQLHQDGLRITSRSWKTSPTVARIKTLPADGYIYANDPSLIYLLTNRNVRRLPRKYSRRHSVQPNEKYLTQMKSVKKRLIAHNGYVVFFNELMSWFKIPEEELQQYIPLVLVDRLPDGAIYQISPSLTQETAKSKPPR